MLRIDKIKELSSSIGWKQNYDTSDFKIDSDLTVSDSGLFYQNFHPLLTLKNLRSISPDFSEVVFSDWDISVSYKTGDKVTINEVNYLALGDSSGQNPEDENSVFWRVFDPFSDWLRSETDAAIINMLNQIYTEKIADKTANSLIEHRALFDNTSRIDDLVTSTNSLVGLEITPIRGVGVTTKIDKIGLHFKGPVETVVVHVMHSSMSSPYRSISLERTEDGSFEWFTLADELMLPYIGDSSGVGGSWYIIYDQKGLGNGVHAVSKNKDWSKKPCNYCNSESRFDYQSQSLWSKYLEIYPFKVQHDNTNMWDVANNLYTYSTNYGINLIISVMCDPSDVMVNKARSLDQVIGLGVATHFIRKMAYNPEYNINRTQQNFNRMELLYELDGDSQSHKKSGLAYNIEKAKKALSIDLDKMSRVCFKCKGNGVRYGSAT